MDTGSGAVSGLGLRVGIGADDTQPMACRVWWETGGQELMVMKG